MKLSKIPKNILIFGDVDYRGACPVETVEQINFFSWLSFHHPDFSAIATHPKMEGARSYQQAAKEKITGSLSKGVSDIVIPCRVPFVCEMKRSDHTKSKIDDSQIEYLANAHNLGAFSCVALGHKGAILAFTVYLMNYHSKAPAKNEN